MAQILQYPNLDVEEYISKISKIGLTLKEQAWGADNRAGKVWILNKYLFEGIGFSTDPSVRFLNELVDRKKGSDICMAVLYAEIARLVGLDAIILKDTGSIIMVECGGILRNITDGKLLPQGSIVRHDTCMFMSQEDILIAIMRNIRAAYVKMLDYKLACRCTDMILAINPESAPDIRDRGILESRMQDPSLALRYLAKYLSINPDANDVDSILELIEDIKQRINQQ